MTAAGAGAGAEIGAAPLQHVSRAASQLLSGRLTHPQGTCKQAAGTGCPSSSTGVTRAGGMTTDHQQAVVHGTGTVRTQAAGMVTDMRLDAVTAGGRSSGMLLGVMRGWGTAGGTEAAATAAGAEAGAGAETAVGRHCIGRGHCISGPLVCIAAVVVVGQGWLQVFVCLFGDVVQANPLMRAGSSIMCRVIYASANANQQTSCQFGLNSAFDQLAVSRQMRGSHKQTRGTA